MSTPPIELIEARLILLEHKLQLLGQEVSEALSNRTSHPQEPSAGVELESNFSSEVAFDADSLSQFSFGFYEREYDSSGDPFRWTGNGPLCELRFFVDRGADRLFRMNTGITEDAILTSLKGFVDYTPIPLAVERKGKVRFVTGIVPKRHYTRLAVMTFLLGGAMIKKKGKNKNSDYQWLGFRFYSLEVGKSHAKEG